jgi:hypothetical protein
MGAGFIIRCSKCEFSVTTSGPWEFYRNWIGKRKPYGHPGPINFIAKMRGIFGFSGILYCLHCDEIFDVILSEFKKPIKDGSSPWGDDHELKDEFKEEKKAQCPKCGNRDMIFSPGESDEITCPRCKEGKLEGVLKYQS